MRGIPCPIAFGLPTPCSVRHWPPHQMTCQMNSVPFSGCRWLFSGSQAAEAHARGQQRPCKWEQGCAQSPQPQVPSPVPSRPVIERGCRWSWAYRALQCLSCGTGQGQDIQQQHREGSVVEQEIQVEKNRIHSPLANNPLANGEQKLFECHGPLEAGDFSAFSAVLPNVQGCRVKARKALGPHFLQVVDMCC